tara:strand:+ start:2919 stop:3407 length:489 start_codon:yes stop_codon:yes gene_type:complete
MYKIIVTGPECSGKTTLAKKLSQYFKISFAKEYAREYLEKNGLVYEQNDLLKIAQKQIEKEKKFNLLDTDLLTIKIWSEYKYGNCNDWILEKIRNQISQKRIYILCKPDIKWQYDPQRENQHNREKLYTIYKKELDLLGHKYYLNHSKKPLKELYVILEKYL